MESIYPTISIITLNINGLKTLYKRQRLDQKAKLRNFPGGSMVKNQPC